MTSFQGWRGAGVGLISALLCVPLTPCSLAPSRPRTLREETCEVSPPQSGHTSLKKPPCIPEQWGFASDSICSLFDEPRLLSREKTWPVSLHLLLSVLSPHQWGFAGDSAGKESARDVGGLGSIPGSGRSPGEGHGNPLQYSRLENPHGQRSLAGCSPWGHRVGHD